jgi:ribosomal protein S18 acetylase RimI-like enzyme
VRTRPLSELSSRDLRPLLQEEVAHWGRELSWDYSDVCSAVASGLDRRALIGYAVQDGARALAYSYYMLDSGRAIVGSVFASEEHRGQGLEETLVQAVLEAALRGRTNERVECQTLFSTSRAADARFEEAGFSSRGRHYLVRALQDPPPEIDAGWKLRPLRREDIPSVARVIHRSHEGSVDAALNLTYATPSHCRSFVETLVLRAGCGRFDPEASFVAESTGGVVGALLASHLSRTNGHICQVSVLPEVHGRGLGHTLMTACLRALRQQGLATASLSVTVNNARAYKLYERLGFRLHRPFAAHAWVRPPARIELPA